MFVLVTGAAGGIGRAITEAVLAAGDEVVALDRAAPPHDPRVHHIAVDLTSEAATRAAAAVACSRFEIAGIVHNAGVMPPRRTTTDEGHELALATHVLGRTC